MASSLNGETRQDDRRNFQNCLTEIFDIDSKSFDVNLTPKGVFLNSIKGSIKALQDPTGLTKKRNSRCCTILFRNILAVSVNGGEKVTKSFLNSLQLGIHLVFADYKPCGRYKIRHYLLVHQRRSVCKNWVATIQNYLNEIIRPRRMKVYLQPYAGKRVSLEVWKSEVEPMLDLALCQADLSIITHNEFVKQDMAHFELDDYDCFVAVGGDGTVHSVISAMLNRISVVDEEQEICLSRKPIPVGIIPTGTTNQIIQSSQGILDLHSAIIHIILGHEIAIDICSIHHDGNFIKWSFFSHYGFFSNVLSHCHKLSLLRTNKLEGAFVKALTKPNFRSYNCEVHFLPIMESQLQKEEPICRQRCRTCLEKDVRPVQSKPKPKGSDVRECEVIAFDESFSSESDAASTFRSVKEIDQEDVAKWESRSGSYLSVSVLSIPALDNYAPLGMSKCCHLHTNSLHLVLVGDADRRDFVRYLSRHGNQKDQMELPFVEEIRCKSVRFIISSRVNEPFIPLRRTNSEVSLVAEANSEDESSATAAPPFSRNRSGSFFGSLRRSSSKNSLSEPGRSRQDRRRLKKAAKERIRQKSFWSHDNELTDSHTDITFNAHSGFVLVYGEGIDDGIADTKARHSCLAVF